MWSLQQKIPRTRTDRIADDRNLKFTSDVGERHFAQNIENSDPHIGSLPSQKKTLINDDTT